MGDHSDYLSKTKHNKPHLIGETFSHGKVYIAQRESPQGKSNHASFFESTLDSLADK